MSSRIGRFRGRMNSILLITTAGTRPGAAASSARMQRRRTWLSRLVVEADVLSHLEGDDPHLRSLFAVKGYDIEAGDGGIDHLENVLIEDHGWGIRYLIIDTRNWWPGRHVLVSPYAVQQIRWLNKQIFLNVSREKVKASPPWAPLDLIDQAYEKRLHRHYDWPGYGW